MRASASQSTARHLYDNPLKATLGDIPLLVLVSGGPLKGGNPLSAAYNQVQQEIYGLSSSSSIQIIAKSESFGDLPVLHLDDVNNAIVAFATNSDGGENNKA